MTQPIDGMLPRRGHPSDERAPRAWRPAYGRGYDNPWWWRPWGDRVWSAPVAVIEERDRSNVSGLASLGLLVIGAALVLALVMRK